MESSVRESPATGPWLPLLRCTSCGAPLEHDPGNAGLRCSGCSQAYPIRHGTLRMKASAVVADELEERERTATSFAYEWERFGGTRDEWERNFLDYMRPHEPAFFAGIRVLDAGTGSGRHARQAALYGAAVA